MTVAVIGGGIGGLTTALAFASFGAKAIVFEQAAEITEVGAGLQITPNGARVLEALGLREYLAQIGIAAEAVVPMDGVGGKPISRFDLSQKSPNYRFVHRAALVEMLADACVAAGVEFVMNARITEVARDGSFLAKGQTYTPDLTAFADGLHSIGRPMLNQNTKPFFTGQVAWRAIVPMRADPVARIWMAPGKHLVTYPLRGGLLNIIAVQEREKWVAEGWSHTDDPQNLRIAFADCAPELQRILERVRSVNLWGLFRHEVAANWVSGTCALLGDAAHPTLPFLAQGANLAIEDAYVLARACTNTPDIATGLSNYQNTRKPRATRAIAAANANAEKYHLTGNRRKIAHLGLKGLGAVAPGAFIKRLDWLYEHDVTA